MENTLVSTLRTLLKNNIVCFTYRKRNGTMRVARGTRNLTIAESMGYSVPTPKNGEQPYSYYDLDCDGWRSYAPENLISIDKVMPYVAPVEEREKPVVVVGAPVHTPVAPTAPVEKTPVTGKGGFGGGMPIGGGFGGGFSGADIDKAMADLDKEIKIEMPVGGGKTGGFIRAEESDGISIDDFARLVARYVVDEIISRITLK